MLRYLLPLSIFIILTFFLARGLTLNPRDIGTTRLNKPAPTFNLPQLQNPAQTLSDKDFLGKVSLLNVWASWCVTCRQEHPLLMALAQQEKVTIYGLNYKDKIADATAVLTRTGNPYVANAFDEAGRVGMDWGVTGTPETFVIDKQGMVRYKHTGPLFEELIREKILPLIRELERS